MQMMPKISCPQRVASDASARSDAGDVAIVISTPPMVPIGFRGKLPRGRDISARQLNCRRDNMSREEVNPRQLDAPQGAAKSMLRRSKRYFEAHRGWSSAREPCELHRPTGV